MADLERPLAVALQATAAARQILLAECARADGPRGEIGKCPADDEAELKIREVLLEAFPDWGFVGEETGVRSSSAGNTCVWFVDPNDGTSSMQRGYRGHAISIGLVRDGVPVLGVVCAVDAPDDRGDLIHWAEGCGAIRRNGTPVALREWPDQLTADDLVGVSQGANRNPVGYAPCVAPARYIGSPSIAYRLALVAAGDYGATLSLNYLSTWDFAAGHALVRAAGGVVLDEHGREIDYPVAGAGEPTRVFAGGRQVVEDLIKVQRQWDGVSRSGFGSVAPPPELAPVRAQAGHLEHDPGVLGRAQGCLLGQLAGDSLGALVEFESASAIARRFLDGGPRRLADGGPHAITAGQPTDDSELALALARSIVTHGGFDAEAVATAYAAWYHGWTHSLEPDTCEHSWCRPFDIGDTTARALRSISAADVHAGTAAAHARTTANAQSQANGALMRVSPIGIWGTFCDDVSDVTAAAMADAALTHPNSVCQTASAVFAATISAAIRDGLNPTAAHVYALRWLGSMDAPEAVLRAVERARATPPDDYLSQQGWVVIALQNAYYQLLHAASLEDGVVETVRRGGDTDTNAAICGALLGAVYGREAIPSQWQRMVLSVRPMPGQADVKQPRAALFWPTDALVLAERLLTRRVS